MELVEQRSADENEGGEATEWRQPYLSPILYSYGRIDDITETFGINAGDAPLGTAA